MIRHFKYILLTVLMCCSFCAETSAQIVAARTDLAMDALLAPSLGVELTLSKKSTLNIDGFYGKKLILGPSTSVWAIQPEWRVYLSGRPMYKFYTGVVGMLGNYDMVMYTQKRWDGKGMGLGVSFGYVMPITQRLLIDFHTSLGYFTYKQKEYWDGDHYDQNYLNEDGYPIANSSGSVIMPIKIGIALTYIIK